MISNYRAKVLKYRVITKIKRNSRTVFRDSGFYFLKHVPSTAGGQDSKRKRKLRQIDEWGTESRDNKMKKFDGLSKNR
jgi:hypothetical protein